MNFLKLLATRVRSSIAVCLLCFVVTNSVPAQDSSKERVKEPVRHDVQTVKELQAALAEIRLLREQKKDSSVHEIVLASGVYLLDKPIELDELHVGQGLTLRAAEKHKVVLSGGQRFKKTAVEDGFHVYKLDQSVRHAAPRAIMINGQLTRPARHPNVGYLRIESSLEDRRSGFIVPPNSLPAAFEKEPTRADLVFFHDWSTSRLPVSSYDPKLRKLVSVGPIGCQAPHYAIDHFEPHPRFALEGHPSFADTPGEWYYDLSSHSIYVRASDEPSDVSVEVPVLETLLSARGSDEQHFSICVGRIDVSRIAFPMPSGGMADAQATMMEPRDAEGKRTTKHRPFLSSAVHVAQATNAIVENCRFTSLGNTGLTMGSRCTQCQVTQCEFEDIGGNGINLGEDNSRSVKGKPWYQSVPEQIPARNILSGNTVRRTG